MLKKNATVILAILLCFLTLMQIFVLKAEAQNAMNLSMQPSKACISDYTELDFSFYWTGEDAWGTLDVNAPFLKFSWGNTKSFSVHHGKNDVKIDVTVPTDAKPGKYTITVKLKIYRSFWKDNLLFQTTKSFVFEIIQPGEYEIEPRQIIFTPYDTYIKIRIKNNDPCKLEYIVKKVLVGNKEIYVNKGEWGAPSAILKPGEEDEIRIPVKNEPPLDVTKIKFYFRIYVYGWFAREGYYRDLVVEKNFKYFSNLGIDVVEIPKILPARRVILPIKFKNNFNRTLQVIITKISVDGKEIAQFFFAPATNIAPMRTGTVKTTIDLSKVDYGKHKLILYVEISPKAGFWEYTKRVKTSFSLDIEVAKPPILEVTPETLEVTVGENSQANIIISNPSKFRVIILSCNVMYRDLLGPSYVDYKSLGLNRKMLEPGESTIYELKLKGKNPGTTQLQLTITYSDEYGSSYTKTYLIEVHVKKTIMQQLIEFAPLIIVLVFTGLMIVLITRTITKVKI